MCSVYIPLPQRNVEKMNSSNSVAVYQDSQKNQSADPTFCSEDVDEKRMAHFSPILSL